ncbi:unnamed protein product [Dovyalis caffra]|uniref:Uncharacterized protein n=1 Tax=Dovyalis caffra TaxID=77055 RepID=A0AAV1QYP7_9ROSI|nr:unnamed protein product [Dovyalis caffra]
MIDVHPKPSEENCRTSDSSMYLSSETGTLFVFFTGGIVLLTLIVNGSTTQFVLHVLDMDKLSATKKRILNYTKYEMLNKALEAFGDLGDDEELGPVDWPTVKRYIASLDNLEGSCEHPHSAFEADNNLEPNNLKDLRIRLLNGVQAAYWGMLDEGRIMQTTANILMQSVDEAIDLASHEPLCDWKGLRSNVHFPSYYKLLQASIIPRKMVTFFTVERLESACYICAAFLRAHRIARRQLHDFIGSKSNKTDDNMESSGRICIPSYEAIMCPKFIVVHGTDKTGVVVHVEIVAYSNGDSDIASIVINESEAEGEEARKFLEDVRVTFPQVLRVVKTRQVTYSVLNHLTDYVQNLEKVGLLEEKEMLHLHDAVQTDLKRLLRNPPLVKVPKITDLIGVHPLLGALPSLVRGPLEGSAKEVMKPRGVHLYKEGSKPNGVWLISNGVVKESAIILAKLLLPQVFEKMSMQELRALVAERSVITTYIRGETIEVPNHSTGFLLEGFIKAHGFQEELIASPAVLLPLKGNQSSQNIEISGLAQRALRAPTIKPRPARIGIFCTRENVKNSAQAASFTHHRSRYQVETRARVIIFDIAAFEADGALRRISSSVLVDHPHRPLTREHGGLVSWPENFYPPRERKQNSEGTDRPANSLSARAMQLSIFGSMVDMRRRAHSFSSSQVKRSHSVSGLRTESFRSRQQVPVPSGATSARRSFEVRNLRGKAPTPPMQSTGINEARIIDNYSDESDAEDEFVVRIDSPSRLSFRHAS